MRGNEQPGGKGTHTAGAPRAVPGQRGLSRPQRRSPCAPSRQAGLLGLAGLTILASTTPCAAVPDHCFSAAASRYGLDASLLRAVAQAESGMNPMAVNESHASRTRSRDIGVMQINTSWLPQLAGYGIKQEHLFDACTNVAVGAWILASEFAKRGTTWDAVGAYNAACSQLKGAACQAARSRYAWRVYGKLVAAHSPRQASTQTAQATASAPIPVEPQRENPAPGLMSVAARGSAQDTSPVNQELVP